MNPLFKRFYASPAEGQIKVDEQYANWLACLTEEITVESWEHSMVSTPNGAYTYVEVLFIQYVLAEDNPDAKVRGFAKEVEDQGCE